jgi:hypothetical protein
MLFGSSGTARKVISSGRGTDRHRGSAQAPPDARAHRPRRGSIRLQYLGVHAGRPSLRHRGKLRSHRCPGRHHDLGLCCRRRGALFAPHGIGASRFGFRELLLAVVALFAAGQVLSAGAVSYAIPDPVPASSSPSAHAIFWSIVMICAAKCRRSGHEAQAP